MNTKDDTRQATDQAVADLDPIQHLMNLDYPRRAGTAGDRKGASYIAQALQESGIEPVVQEFHFAKPKVLPRLVLPLVLLTWTALSLANLRSWDSNTIISWVVLALPLSLILAMLNLNLVMPYFLGRRRKKLLKVAEKIQEGTLSPDQVVTSQNVIAEIGPEDADQEILFTAHHDSISSKLPRQMIWICAIVGFFGFLLYGLAYLAHALALAFLDLNLLEAYFPLFTALAAAGLFGLEMFFVARLFRSNASHGSIDDGTGVAILLELAKYIKTHEIPGFRFTFGFFGAEESGLVGSTHYYLHRVVDKTRLRVITIDMIGERPPLSYVKGLFLVNRRRMDAAFNAQIAAIAQALGVKIKGKSFPYPGSDFAHFMLDGGCTTNWLINGSRRIHSKKDNLGSVNQELVKDALKLVVAYLLQSKEEKA